MRVSFELIFYNVGGPKAKSILSRVLYFSSINRSQYLKIDTDFVITYHLLWIFDAASKQRKYLRYDSFKTLLLIVLKKDAYESEIEKDCHIFFRFSNSIIFRCSQCQRKLFRPNVNPRIGQQNWVKFTTDDLSSEVTYLRPLKMKL